MSPIILCFYFQVTKCSYFVISRKGSLKASFKESVALRGYNLEWRHGGQRKWAKVKSLFCAIASVTILKVLCTLYPKKASNPVGKCYLQEPHHFWKQFFYSYSVWTRKYKYFLRKSSIFSFCRTTYGHRGCSAIFV